MSGLKMAKADPEEFERVMSFVRVMEALFESRSFFSNEEDWREWDDDDEDKKMLLAIEKEVKEEDGTDCYSAVHFVFIPEESENEELVKG